MNEVLVTEHISTPISREDAKKQFDYWTTKLGIIHTFTFDEMYDCMLEKRIQKQKQDNYRKNILNFEDKVKQTPGVLGADPFPLEKTIADGLYVRKLTVPAQTLTITKIHAVNHVFFLMKGTVSILTEDGVKKITAPYQGVTKAGTKRIIWHHDEVIFTTVHNVTETDMDKVELEVFAEDFEGLEDKLEAQKIIDFLQIISERESV